MSEQREKNAAEEIEFHLFQIMKKEVSAMRDILANMQQEERLLLINDIQALNAHGKEKQILLGHLILCREEKVELLKKAAFLLKADTDFHLQFDSRKEIGKLAAHLPGEGTDILILQDQLLALLEESNKQNDRNNYLIENRIRYTQGLIQRAFPCETLKTYGDKGNSISKKVQLKTITLLDREG